MSDFDDSLRIFRAEAIDLVSSAPKGACAVCRSPVALPYLAELTNPAKEEMTFVIDLCYSCTEVWNINAEECERLGYLSYCRQLIVSGRATDIHRLNRGIVETNQWAAKEPKKDFLDLNNLDAEPF